MRLAAVEAAGRAMVGAVLVMDPLVVVERVMVRADPFQGSVDGMLAKPKT
jgi:hypothetical protein